MKILFLARSMLRGGAERQLAVLASGLQQRGHQVAVALFYDEGDVQEELQRNGVQILHLRKKGRWDVLPFFRRLVQHIADFAPDVVHGYLPVPNCLAWLATRVSGVSCPVVFGIRASDVRSDSYDRLSGLSYRLEEYLAPRVALSIANSQAGRDRAVEAGFPPDRMVVIANGIDTDRFRPDAAARQTLRQFLELEDHHQLIGMVGRLDPMKDHTSFLRAAALVAENNPNLHVLCVGDGPDSYRRLMQDVGRGLGERLHWLPSRRAVEQIYPALDLLVSASAFGEGFSNVLAEAMACGVPCIATQVGDAGLILGDEQALVPVGSPGALAAAITATLQRPHDPAALRQRIMDHFSIGRLVNETEAALISVQGG